MWTSVFLESLSQPWLIENSFCSTSSLSALRGFAVRFCGFHRPWGKVGVCPVYSSVVAGCSLFVEGLQWLFQWVQWANLKIPAVDWKKLFSHVPHLHSDALILSVMVFGWHLWETIRVRWVHGERIYFIKLVSLKQDTRDLTLSFFDIPQVLCENSAKRWPSIV